MPDSHRRGLEAESWLAVVHAYQAYNQLRVIIFITFSRATPPLSRGVSSSSPSLRRTGPRLLNKPGFALYTMLHTPHKVGELETPLQRAPPNHC